MGAYTFCLAVFRCLFLMRSLLPALGPTRPHCSRSSTLGGVVLRCLAVPAGRILSRVGRILPSNAPPVCHCCYACLYPCHCAHVLYAVEHAVEHVCAAAVHPVEHAVALSFVDVVAHALVHAIVHTFVHAVVLAALPLWRPTLPCSFVDLFTYLVAVLFTFSN